MKLLNHTADKATLDLIRHELLLASALIQEGRMSHQCDSPEGQALEVGIRSM
jgi:hypothetical protein